MRNLIRPTLFIIARLGLFLAVVAWIVGQWMDVHFSVHGIALSCTRYGWLLQIDSTITEFGVIVEHLSGLQNLVEDLKPVLPGIGRENRGDQRFVMTHHFFVVTMFALFNGVLMWVYRKRGKELAADE